MAGSDFTGAATCRSGEAFSDEGQAGGGQFGDDNAPEWQYEGKDDSSPVDESLDVLPHGISAAPEVYSPMSHGATRVRSMITNRPIMLDDPVSPVAKRLGATVRRNSQVTFSDSELLQHSMEASHVPSQSQEVLHHDWWESAEPLPDQTLPAPLPAVETATADANPAVEADAEEHLSETQALGGTLKQAQSKFGKIGNLFRRSTKRTVQTQANGVQDDETQTMDEPEAETGAQLGQTNALGAQPPMGAELSFGDALKTQTAPAEVAQAHNSAGQAGLMLSDLIEQHGPLAMNALSSPVHTAPLAVPLEQHSPAELAGYGEMQEVTDVTNSQAAVVMQSTGDLQQAALMPKVMSTDLTEMTFQVLQADALLFPTMLVGNNSIGLCVVFKLAVEDTQSQQ